jgi:hypothetical protein
MPLQISTRHLQAEQAAKREQQDDQPDVAPL